MRSETRDQRPSSRSSSELSQGSEPAEESSRPLREPRRPRRALEILRALPIALEILRALSRILRALRGGRGSLEELGAGRGARGAGSRAGRGGERPASSSRSSSRILRALSDRAGSELEEELGLEELDRDRPAEELEPASEELAEEELAIVDRRYTMDHRLPESSRSTLDSNFEILSINANLISRAIFNANPISRADFRIDDRSIWKEFKESLDKDWALG